MVKDLHRNSKMHHAVLKALAKEVVHLKGKQAERKTLKAHKQQLWHKVRELKDRLSSVESAAHQKEVQLTEAAEKASDVASVDLPTPPLQELTPTSAPT